MDLSPILIKAHQLLDAATVSNEMAEIDKGEQQLRDLNQFLGDTLDPPPVPIPEPKKQDGDAR